MFFQTSTYVQRQDITARQSATSRTINRIVTDFYWPEMQFDVKIFCRSCDTCQKTESWRKVCRVSLGSMPIMDEPFKRVPVHSIGPLPSPTEKSNRINLTLVDTIPDTRKRLLYLKITQNVSPMLLLSCFPA
jgi:hypothetical protein